MSFFYRNDLAENAPALGGKGHILVVAAEEPFFVVQLQQDLIEEEVQPVRLAQRQRSKIQEPAWGVVGQHIIYLPAVFFQRLFAAGIFLIRGHLLRPPVDPRLRSSLSWLSAPPKQRYFLPSSVSTLPRQTW